MKKLLSAFLSLVLILSVFSAIPFTASALTTLKASANLDENTYYEFNSGSGKLSIFSRKAESQPMPDYGNSGDNASPFKDHTEIKKVEIYDVTTVGELAFYGCTGITSVEFLNTDTTSIGFGSFYGCTALSSVTFPWYLTSIGIQAFSGCTSLTEANLPDTVVYINASAFSGCSNLKKVVINNPNCSLGNKAFMNCTSLTEITVPGTVSVFQNQVFSGCSALTRISFLLRKGTIHVLDSAFSGCDALTDIYYAGTEEQWNGIYWYQGNDAVQKATVHYNSIWGRLSQNMEYVYNPAEKVLTLSGTGGTGSFTIHPHNRSPWYYYKDEIESVVIEEGITAINSLVFYNHSNLRSITIPHSLTFFDKSAVSNDDALTDIYYMGTESEWASLNTGSLSVENIHFHEHSWGAWTVTKAATCTAAGTRVHTCSVGGEEETGTIDATGHKMTYVAAKAATTSATGNKAYYKCSVCKKLFTDKAGKTETTLAKVTIAKLAVYTITYKLDGGKNGKNPTSYNVTTATITLKNPTKTGYTFKGWYSDAKFKTKVTQIAKGSTGNKTLYAKWAKNSYKITYNLNGGKNGKNPANYNVTTATITLKNPTKTGYTFKGWYSDAKFKTKVAKITKGSTGNKTLYAKWQKNTYKITYKLNGGTNGKNPKTYTVTTATVTLKNPTRKGYTFKGWYSDAKFKKKVTKITKGSTGNKTLYAKWVKKK